MRRLGAWLFFGGFASGLVGTTYVMIQAFNAEPSTDLSRNGYLIVRFTFAGLFVSAVGGLLFLVSLRGRQTATSPADPKLENLRSAVLIYFGLNYCEVCRREANPDAPVSTDEEFEIQAARMLREGWTSPDACTVLCPECQ